MFSVLFPRPDVETGWSTYKVRKSLYNWCNVNAGIFVFGKSYCVTKLYVYNFKNVNILKHGKEPEARGS